MTKIRHRRKKDSEKVKPVNDLNKESFVGGGDKKLLIFSPGGF